MSGNEDVMMTDDDIGALLSKARQANDSRTARLCWDALGGDLESRVLCAGLILEV